MRLRAGADPLLPAALDIPLEVVEHAIEETRRQIAEAQEAARQAREAAWRAASRPHAIILTKRALPQPIFVASIIGVERLLRTDFNVALPPVSMRVAFTQTSKPCRSRISVAYDPRLIRSCFLSPLGEMDGDRLTQLAYFDRHTMVLNQEPDLLGEVGAEQVGPRHGGLVNARSCDETV